MRQAIYLCYLGLVISKVLLLLQSVIFPEFFMLLKSCISVFASERQLFQQVCTGSLWKTITFLSIARDFENFSEKKKKTTYEYIRSTQLVFSWEELLGFMSSLSLVKLVPLLHFSVCFHWVVKNMLSPTPAALVDFICVISTSQQRFTL